jgi:hypothetical protein
VDLALGALFASEPWLNVWLVRDFVRWLAVRFSDKLWILMTTMINLAYVVLRNKELQKAFTEKALILKGIAISDGIGSPAYLAARKVHQHAFAAHVRSLLVPAA